MKFLLYALFTILFTFHSYGQEAIFLGAKAGINYNNLDELTRSGGSIGNVEMFEGKPQIGYQAGFYGQANFTAFYLRVEVLFAQSASNYVEAFSEEDQFVLRTLEVPALIGFNLVKPLSLYLGPSLIFSVDTDFSEFFDLEMKKSLYLGLNLGAAIQLDKLGLDLRYTRGLSDNFANYFDAIPLDGAGYSISTRANQFALSLSYQLN